MLRIMSAVVVVALKITFPQLYPMIFVIHITILLKIRNFIISNQTVLPLFIFYLSLRTFKQNTSKKKAPKPTYLPSNIPSGGGQKRKAGCHWYIEVEVEHRGEIYFCFLLWNSFGKLWRMVESIGEESMPWSCCDYLITQECRNASNNNKAPL